MPAVAFVLSPFAARRIHDVLVCLSKLSESVSIEAKAHRLCLCALNSTNSAYARFGFADRRFFESYRFDGRGDEDAKFVCRLHVKALLPVFRQRYVDSRDGGTDTAIERCSVSINGPDDEDRAACRVLARLHCKHGVVKTYKLTYEDADVMHAVFDRDLAPNKWRISSRLLKEYLEHFGPKAEFVDISGANGRVAFTSFTEKVIEGREILKQPLQTTVVLDTADFDTFVAEEGLHVAVALKDLKAIAAHADSVGIGVNAFYSTPGKPLHIEYARDGMQCEFTLMTLVDNGAFKGFSGLVASVPGGATGRARSIPAGTAGSARNAATAVPAGSARSAAASQQPTQRIPSGHSPQPTPPAPTPSILIRNDNTDLYEVPAARRPTTTPELAPSRKDPPLFLSYSESSTDEDDDLGRGLDDMPMVAWDTSGTRGSTVIARDEVRSRDARDREEAERTRAEEEARMQAGGEDVDEDEEMSESAVGPTQDRSQAQGLFDWTG